MSPDTSDVVARMYEVLVEEIRTHRPELLDEGFTVAEIYQNLVPYRSHRDRIGIEMNGDYEHALVRLLAGEGGYVELESDAARERLQEELDSVHPDTGVYRNFAACEVRLSDDRPAGGPAGRPADPGTPMPAGVDDGEGVAAAATSSNGSGLSWAGEGAGEEAEVPATESATGEGEGGAPRTDETAAGPEPGEADPDLEGPVPEKEAVDEPAEEADPDATCQWCRERLPEREDLRFCPFCGSRVDRVPCPECGTELEDDWLFCVSCGTHVQE